jgi:hypothetical protein
MIHAIFGDDKEFFALRHGKRGFDASTIKSWIWQTYRCLDQELHHLPQFLSLLGALPGWGIAFW